jgi:hypothetical protein
MIKKLSTPILLKSKFNLKIIKKLLENLIKNFYNSNKNLRLYNTPMNMK